MRRRQRFSHTQEENFWPAFTDVISTIIIIVFFITLLIIIQNIIAGNQLDFMRTEIETMQAELEEKQFKIKNSEDEILQQKENLATLQEQVNNALTLLQDSQKEIEDQRLIIANSNSQLTSLQSKLEGIAVLRLDVLSKVKASIEAELGEKNAKGEDLVLISENGNIIINESLVFDFNSFEVKPEGQELLASLANAFEEVLGEDDVRQYIESINIQGHTDERSSAEVNRELSSKRASSVVNYMMSSNTGLEDKYGAYFAASGYSEFRPIDEGKTEEAYAKNRRIEISLVLKDSNIQKVIDDYLNESLKPFTDGN